MKRFKFIYFGQLLIASSDYIFLCSTFCLVKLPLTVRGLASVAEIEAKSFNLAAQKAKAN